MFISDDDKKIFQDAMEGVKKYDKKNDVRKETPRQKIIPLIKKTTHTDNITITPKMRISLAKEPTVTGMDIISYAKNGVQHKQKQRLKKSTLLIEATLDLHEHTSDEALIATDNFIERCQQKGFRTVCIIHGKGLYSSNNNPVLKNLLNRYLRQHESITAFHSSKNNTGSIIVLLKNITIHR